MKIKKILSCFLAASTMAFSGPMAFADWEYIDTGLKSMLDFTKLKHPNFRGKWCWLSTSLKLLEYWTTKRGLTGAVNRKLLNACNKMNGLVNGSDSARRKDFTVYLPLFDRIRSVLDVSQKYVEAFRYTYPVDIHSDNTCDVATNAKAIEVFLNDIYSSEKPFYFFEHNVICDMILCSQGNDRKFISSEDMRGFNLSSYDFMEKVVTENKCPVIATIGMTLENSFLSMNEVKQLIQGRSARQLHCLLVTGVDRENKKVMLTNPTPSDGFRRDIEMSKDDFDRCVVSVHGVLNKPILPLIKQFIR